MRPYLQTPDAPTGSEVKNGFSCVGPLKLGPDQSVGTVPLDQEGARYRAGVLIATVAFLPERDNLLT